MLNLQKKYRYPGLQSFTEAQQDLFFGRTDDIKHLTSLILLEKLIILFGKSGYGKSSLINAGIIPELSRESQKRKIKYNSYVIRFQPYSVESTDSLIDKFVFNLSIKENEVDNNNLSFLPKTIWGEIKKRHLKTNDSIVLFFDQFEEIFTYPEQDQDEFIRQIADLLFSDIPEYVNRYEDVHTKDEVDLMVRKIDCKVVFSLRSDRISELDRFKPILPFILNKRYELKPLKPEQAKEALINPARLDDSHLPNDTSAKFESSKFNWMPDALENVIRLLLNKSKISGDGIESFLLQILAQHIELKVISGQILDRNNDGTPDVTTEDLPSVSNLYENFYENAIKTLQFKERKLSQNLIEKGLIFEDDQQRINIHEKLVTKNYKISPALLTKLIDLRLVRAENSTSGGFNIELSHDSFVKPILISSQKRKNKNLKRWLRGTSVALVLSLITFGISILFEPLDTIQHYSVYITKYNKQIDSLSTTLAKVEEKKQELDIKVKKFETKFDSIETIASDEERVKKIILQYIDCINNHDVKCISSLVADTMDRYYKAPNISRKEREKLERQYFNKYSMERITAINDIIVKMIDSTKTYTVNASTIYNYKDKGETPVIYRFKINKNLKVNSLTAYIQGDK